MNMNYIRDDLFVCKYCDNNNIIQYYYKFPSCNHELCYKCIEELKNGIYMDSLKYGPEHVITA